MADINELYQSIILDHNKNPRHYGELTGATHQAEGYNPLCGDKVEVFLRIEDGYVSRAAFVSASCAICKASASMMVDTLEGMGLKEAHVLVSEVNELLDTSKQVSEEVDDEAPKRDLDALMGVRAFRARIRCALLPWNTFDDIFKSEG